MRTRVAGRPAVALHGPEAARFFYDEDHIERHGALPEPIRSTLLGQSGVQTLDGQAHRVRKAMFLSLMTEAGIAELCSHVDDAFDRALDRWADGHRIVLFDEIAGILTRAVCRWSGVPVAEEDLPGLAADLIALVDGFGSLGPAHIRARLARRRLEQRLGDLVRDARTGTKSVPAGSVLDVVARHHDADGALLDARVGAVELLNVLRPTVAVTWYVAFAAHALHRWPASRVRLREDGPAFAEAFAQEVRRFYPFAPYVAGKATRDLVWRGEPIPAGTMVLLDVYGHHHDPILWPDPYAFVPERFLGREIGAFDLIPQGGGDPRTGHRCPGEGITAALLAALSIRLAALDYRLPDQDLRISLRRIPTRPASGVVLMSVRTADRRIVAGPGPS